MKIRFNGSTKSENPQVEKGLNVAYAGSKRAAYQFRWYLLVLLVTSPIALVLWLFLFPKVSIVAPGIVTSEPLTIRAPYDGVIKSVHVSKAMNVEQAQDLIILSNTELEAQYNEINRQMMMLYTQQMPQSQIILSQLEQRKKVAKQGVQRQKELLEKYESFKQKGVIPAADLASAVNAYNAAQMAYEQTKVDISREKERQELERRFGLKGQRYNDLSYEFSRLAALKQSLFIKTDNAGRIEDVLVQTGDRVTAGQPLLLIDTQKESKVVAYLDPKHLEYSNIGQEAQIRFPDGTKLNAKISEPTELTSRLPSFLMGPFEGEKTALKITLSLPIPNHFQVEGLPIDVRFKHQKIEQAFALFKEKSLL